MSVKRSKSLKISTEDRKVEVISDIDNDSEQETTHLPTNPNKRRKKNKNVMSKITKTNNNSNNGSEVSSAKIKSPTPQNFNNNLSTDDITLWSNSNLEKLLENIEKTLPANDSIDYNTRLNKIDWNKIKLPNFSTTECKKVFLQVQENVRTFRTLQEIVNDAKKWVSSRPDNQPRSQSPYSFFCAKKRNKIRKSNPDLSESNLDRLMKILYNELSLSEKELNENEALAFGTKNGSDIKANDECKKDISEITETSTTESKHKKNKVKRKKEPVQETEKKQKDIPPRKSRTPFSLYVDHQLKNSAVEGHIDKNSFREKCKVEFKNLPPNEKISWINLAEEDFKRYQNEVNLYQEKHPEYSVKPMKSVLTKQEKMMKERIGGKPVKPPNSAYGVFSSSMLRSETIKSIHPKEKMNYIGTLWKKLTPEEKNVYQMECDKLMENYKSEYAEYVKTLPQGEQEAEQRKPSKKKQTKAQSKEQESDQVIKPSTSKEKPNQSPKKRRLDEPAAPPLTAKKYFINNYKGSDPPLQAWKSLSPKMKQKIEDELTTVKKTYIKDFKKFLNSLSESEVKEYAMLKDKHEEEVSESESDSDDDEDNDEVAF